jgi:bla regulator protein blaR1
MRNRGKEARSGWGKLLLITARIMALGVPVVVGLLASPQLRAQATAGRSPATQTPTAATDQLKFEAVSIKLNKSESPVMAIPLKQPGGHVTATNSTLRFLITAAYDLPFLPRQTQTTIVGTPNWVDSEHFDIEAETPGNPSEAEKRLMIQSLLADRFKLAVHHETRQFPVFALLLAESAKRGPQLQPHGDDAKCFDLSSGPPPVPGSDGAPPMPPCGNFGVIPGASWSLVGGNVTMQMLAKTLSYMQGIDRAVIDRTGLSGNFEVRLDWTPQVALSEPDASAAPSLFTAIKEQLGLKLEPQTGLVDVLVIDHVEEPSPN